MRLFRLIAIAVLTCGLATAAAAPQPRLKPEAPASPWIARDQALALRSVFEALDERQYDAARAFAATLTDPLAARIARWALLRSDAPGYSLADHDAFLDTHPAWPSLWSLQRQAEALIDEDTPPREIIAFFDTREPLSGFGKLHLGRALIAVGREDLAAGYLRKAWIEHNFTSRDSRMILDTYGDYLREEDHFAKADRALFGRTTAGLEDVAGLLSDRHAKEIAVRRNLIRGRSSGRAGFNRLPADSQRDPGVLHAMVRYLRRADRDEEAIRLAGIASAEGSGLRDAEAWYYETRILTRWALKNGRFEDAYALSAYSGLREGGWFAEAEFMAGWIALRFLGDAERAAAHFRFLTEHVSSPISLARGNYWQARAASALGDEKRAKSHYLVAAHYPYTYYGQLAAETLGRSAPLFDFPEDAPVTNEDRLRLAERDLTRALHILDHIGQDITFRRFAMALDDQLTDEREILAYAELVRAAGHVDLAVRGGKATRSQGMAVPQVIYPRYPVPEAATRFAEEPLILGLSRQESEFRVSAYSSARAKGVMQLIDSTARITARKENLPYEPARLLWDPAYNMTLGAAHLSHLLERFGGSYVMVLAAYNAGPHRVDDWIETYGDPRSPDIDPVDWVELIPFSETRNYVMRVLENTQVYRARLSGMPLGIALSEDLTRGSPSTMAVIGKPIPAPQLWATADRAGAPLIGHNQRSSPPLAVLRTQQSGPAAEIIPRLSPSGHPVPVSNR